MTPRVPTRPCQITGTEQVRAMIRMMQEHHLKRPFQSVGKRPGPAASGRAARAGRTRQQRRAAAVFAYTRRHPMTQLVPAEPTLEAIRATRARLGDRVLTTPVRLWQDGALEPRGRARDARLPQGGAVPAHGQLQAARRAGRDAGPVPRGAGAGRHRGERGKPRHGGGVRRGRARDHRQGGDAEVGERVPGGGVPRARRDRGAGGRRAPGLRARAGRSSRPRAARSSIRSRGRRRRSARRRSASSSSSRPRASTR